MSWCADRQRPIIQARPIQVAEHIADAYQDYSRSYVNVRVSALKAFYGWAVQHGLRRGNPATELRMRKERIVPREPFAEEEVRSLVKAAATREELAVVLLLIDAGLRRSELLGLETTDVDWLRGHVLVRGKGSRQRLVAPGHVAFAALREHVGHRRGRVFTFQRSTLLRMLRAIGKRAGVRDCYPHRFRVTFITWMLDQGVDLISVAVMVGHSNLETTRIYLRATERRRALGSQRSHSIADALARRADAG